MAALQLDITGLSGLASGLNVIVGLFAGVTGTATAGIANLSETITGQGSYAFSGTVDCSVTAGALYGEARNCAGTTTAAFNAATSAANLLAARWYMGQVSGGAVVGNATVAQIAAGILLNPANLIKTDSQNAVSIPAATTAQLNTIQSAIGSVAGDAAAANGQSAVAAALVTGSAVLNATALAAVASAAAQAGSGTGPIPVNQNTGGTGNLMPTINGVGQANVTINSYLQSDYAAGNIALNYVRGQALTDTNGNWISPMKLAAGTYAFTFFGEGIVFPSKQNVVVS